MPENVYEIRITGDAGSLVAATEQAKTAVASIGTVAASQASRGVKGLSEEVQKLHLGFRDTTSAGRVFIYSLAQEMNPAVTAAIGQARMLSFALLNFRNILSPALIGTLAISAGALQFFTNQAQRLAEVQLKANRAVREFDTGALITGMRETNFELEKLVATYETRFEKFKGIGAIAGVVGGAIVGATKFGAALGLPAGPAGVMIGGSIGAATGLVGGAALFGLMNEQQKEEYRKILEIYKKELAKLLPFEQAIAQAMRVSIESRYEMALARSEYDRRRMMGMPYEFWEKRTAGTGTERGIRATFHSGELSYVFGTQTQTGQAGLLETELLKAQEAERLSLQKDYEREYGKAVEAGEDAIIILTEQFETKRTQLTTQHNQQRLELEVQYRQNLLKRAGELEERLGALTRQETPFIAEEASIVIKKFFEPESTRELLAFTDQWKELVFQIEMLGATADPATQAFLRLYNTQKELLKYRSGAYGPVTQTEESFGGQIGPKRPIESLTLLEMNAEDIRTRTGQIRDQFKALGEAWNEEVIERTVNAERRAASSSLMLRLFRAPREAALAEAERKAEMGETLGEQGTAGIEVGFMRLQQQAGTFGTNMAEMMQGIGSAMSRGLEDTFFSVVTGQFRSLVDVARQVGYAIVREMTSVTAKMATRGLFGQGGQGGGLLGGLLSMIGSWFGGGGGSLPALTYVQHGGIVTRPTIAMIGEAGPEAVIPLDRAEREGRFGGGGGGVTVINLSDRDQLATIVAQEMARGREVIVNDVVSNLRGNTALRRGIQRFGK